MPMGESARATLKAVTENVAERARWTIGYPCARTHGLVDWSQLDDLNRWMVNNVGDPWDDDRTGFSPHVRPFEREVLARAARWFRAPEDYWGCIAHSGSEAIGQGLWCGRAALPDAVFYHSTAAHMGVATWQGIHGFPSVAISTDDSGALDYIELAERIDPNRPAIIAATAGTTTTEAVDDVAAIHAALDVRGISADARYVHLDAALSGLHLGVSPRQRCWQQVRMRTDDFASGADSVSVSTHKFLGTPAPGGIFLTRANRMARLRRSVAYLNSNVATIACSRNGQAAAQAWFILAHFSDDELHALAERGRRLARWLHGQLRHAGVPAHRHRDGLTVSFPVPPEHIRIRYGIHGTGRVVCVPGIDEDVLRAFVADMRGARKVTVEPLTTTHPKVRTSLHGTREEEFMHD